LSAVEHAGLQDAGSRTRVAVLDRPRETRETGRERTREAVLERRYRRDRRGGARLDASNADS
jgi:hypothetical protein